MTCAICKSHISTLYQCCPNNEHSLCESCCVNIVSSLIKNGKIALLFMKKIPCYICTEKFQLNHLPPRVQMTLNNILSTIPKTSKNPQSIEEFNYYYNQFNQLRHCLTNEKFIFISQRHYQLLGKCIEKYIQLLMKSYPWNYEEIWLPLTNDNHARVNIFLSEDFRTNHNGCLILIQGIGAVRAGQWARSCCINESLDIGAMFPYMTKARENNLSVIILNPNETTYTTEENTSVEDLRSFYLSSNPLPHSSTTPIPGLSTCREHILYVYDHIIEKLSPAKQFYIVAHSAGGDHLMHLLRQRQDLILPKLSKIAFIDSVHSISPSDTNEIKTFLRQNAVHFIPSNQPMGHTVHILQNSICLQLSAGHLKHEYTSGHSINGVFQFFFPSSINIYH